jgi:hypothetical protein
LWYDHMLNHSVTMTKWLGCLSIRKRYCVWVSALSDREWTETRRYHLLIDHLIDSIQWLRVWHTKKVLVANMCSVSINGKHKWLSSRNLSQADLVSRLQLVIVVRKISGLTKLSSDSTLRCRISERHGLLNMLSLVVNFTY